MSSRFSRWSLSLLAIVAAVWGTRLYAAEPAPAKTGSPNVILILADDLGYGELGCYGQTKIKTPRLDRLAREGLRFTQFYTACPVCAPARCGLLTGRHMGHADVRDNREQKPEGQWPIPAERLTLFDVFQRHGYATAAIGKWGLGPMGSSGDPLKHGVETFFGYNCQRHAHSHFPKWLWDNDRKLDLPGNNEAQGPHYSHDLFESRAMEFVRRNKERPFLLYLPVTIPHVALQIPDAELKEYQGQWDDPPYTGGRGYRPHAQPRAAYAAMVSRLDRTVGKLADLVDELGLGERTLILFTSDNGPTHGGVGGSDSEFFQSAANLRGLKGSVYEGGIRVPLVARWSRRAPAGSTITGPCVAYDLLPTLCELAGAKPPAEVDGVSLATTIKSAGPLPAREFLYWEFAGYGGQQAVRLGDWKGVRQQLQKGPARTELYNLARDEREQHDVSGKHPEIVARIERILRDSHAPSKEFPLKGLGEGAP